MNHSLMNEYDVVIIGSGLGGLASGVILAKEGYKVCVLEKNKQIGGTLQTFARDKVIFDSGIHYVGGLNEGQTLYKLFKYLGIMHKLKMAKMDENAYDVVSFNDEQKEYHYAQGYDRFIENLVADFPEEECAIRKYCEVIQDVCSKFPMYNLKPGNYADTASMLELDTKTFLESITSNKRLQNVLAGTNLLYAGQAYKTPLYVHALIINHYTDSSWRFVNGGSQIGKHLAHEIYTRGGVIKKHTKVVRLVEEDGLMRYAETESGERYYGKQFISNAHPHKTMEMTSSELIKKVFRNRVKNIENSISTFYVNVVFKKNAFLYHNRNYYHFAIDDAWTAMDYTDENWPLGFALFFGVSPKTTTYAETATIMGYMKFDDVKKWEHTHNIVSQEENRGEDYEQFKKEKSELLLDLVEKRFPGFKNSVDKYYSASPLTWRDYIGTDDGSMYGFVKDYREPLKTFFSPRTKIPNFFLTGQNLNLHGVLGVTVSAVVTCSEIVGREQLLEEINKV